MHACSVFRRNSIVCVSVYTRPRLYIGPSDYLFMYHCFSDVCVCVCVCFYGCAKVQRSCVCWKEGGDVECRSTQGAEDMA